MTLVTNLSFCFILQFIDKDIIIVCFYEFRIILKITRNSTNYSEHCWTKMGKRTTNDIKESYKVQFSTAYDICCYALANFCIASIYEKTFCSNEWNINKLTRFVRRLWIIFQSVSRSWVSWNASSLACCRSNCTK